MPQISTYPLQLANQVADLDVLAIVDVSEAGTGHTGGTTKKVTIANLRESGLLSSGGLGDVVLSGVPTAGQVPIASGPLAATWGTLAGSTGSSDGPSPYPIFTRSEFDTAVVTERSLIASTGTGRYAEGQLFQIVGEAGQRIWTIGTGGNNAAIASASHARKVSLRPGLVRVLTTDANTCKETSGAPSGGTEGDVAVDWSGNLVYLRGTLIWSSVSPAHPVTASNSEQGGTGRPARESVIASRAGTPLTYTAPGSGNMQMMCRNGYRAMDAMSSFKMFFANWHGKDESSTGLGTLTVQASVEYPIGTVAAVATFSGGLNGTILPGASLTTDPILLEIPDGERFAVRVWVNSTAGTPIYFDSAYSLGSGAVDITDISTLNGTPGVAANRVGTVNSAALSINNANNNAHYRPVALIGLTSKPVFAILGDSISAYVVPRDAVLDRTCAGGIVGKSLREDFSYINVSAEGQTLNAVATNVNFNKRNSLIAAWVTHVICQLGINDIITGRSALQVMGDLQALKSLHGRPVFQTTITPKSTSSDGFLTVANQTTDALNSVRVDVNTRIRAGQSYAHQDFIEVADAVESARNSGKWKADGVTAGLYTPDGLHGNVFSYLAVESSQAFRKMYSVK